LRIVFLCVPPNRRDPLRDFFTEVEEKLGGFLVGQTILCLAIGAMSLAAYSLIGLPYAFVLAIIAAIMEAVPVIGPVLGAIPALLIASSSDPTKVVWVIAASLLIQLIENYLLVPRIMKKSLGVNPLVVLLALVAFSSLFGLLGAILAIPIAAIFQLGVTRFVIRPADPDIPKSNGRGQVSFLRYEAQHLAQDMRKLLRRGHSEVDSEEDRTLDALESIVRDLDLYLGESEQKASLS
jgi:predicted PurR-regulated permease PerM